MTQTTRSGGDSRDGAPPLASSTGWLLALLVGLVAVVVTTIVVSMASSVVRKWWWLVLVVGVVGVAGELFRSIAGATKGRTEEPGSVSSGRARQQTSTAPGTDVAPMPERREEPAPSLATAGAPSVPEPDVEQAAVVPGFRPGGVPANPATARIVAATIPKSSHTPEQSEDSWSADVDRGIVAVADGAASAFMSREWAAALTERFVAQPNLTLITFRAWLLAASRDWVPAQHSPEWWAEDSAARGSAATLVGLSVDCRSEDALGRWEAVAVGDSLLVQVATSGGGARRVVAFPAHAPEDFGRHPDLLVTITDAQRESVDLDLPALWRAGGEFRHGDVFLLMTDALAEWALSTERSDPGVWDLLLSLDANGLASLVEQERAASRLHDDDTTLVCFRPWNDR